MHWQTFCFALCTIQRGYNKNRNQTNNNKKFDVFNLHSINRLQAPGVEREAFLSKQKHICAQPKISSLQLGATTDCTMKWNRIVMDVPTRTIFQSFVIFKKGTIVLLQWRNSMPALCRHNKPGHAAWWRPGAGCSGAGWEWCWRKCAPPTKSSQSFLQLVRDFDFCIAECRNTPPCCGFTAPASFQKTATSSKFLFVLKTTNELSLRHDESEERVLLCPSRQPATFTI